MSALAQEREEYSPHDLVQFPSDREVELEEITDEAVRNRAGVLHNFYSEKGVPIPLFVFNDNFRSAKAAFELNSTQLQLFVKTVRDEGIVDTIPDNQYSATGSQTLSFDYDRLLALGAIREALLRHIPEFSFKEYEDIPWDEVAQSAKKSLGELSAANVINTSQVLSDGYGENEESHDASEMLTKPSLSRNRVIYSTRFLSEAHERDEMRKQTDQISLSFRQKDVKPQMKHFVGEIPEVRTDILTTELPTWTVDRLMTLSREKDIDVLSSSAHRDIIAAIEFISAYTEDNFDAFNPYPEEVNVPSLQKKFVACAEILLHLQGKGIQATNLSEAYLGFRRSGLEAGLRPIQFTQNIDSSE